MEGEGLSQRKILGLDVGNSRIGVAIGDASGIVVSPLPAIQRSSLEEDFGAVLRLTEEHGTRAVVVGLPISLSGRMGPQARLVRRFIQALAKELPIPVHSQDERFSTVEAERLLHEAGHQPSRGKGLRDSASAAVILWAYMDSEHNR
ncbi:MAG: Holliday junction resolvase RuvX [Dehalococcoidia bacterium]|jgi:putative Holliday junction resolvase|nr:Holliday junction resolvase RuvX [Dehalococcoidia bacterium]